MDDAAAPGAHATHDGAGSGDPADPAAVDGTAAASATLTQRAASLRPHGLTVGRYTRDGDAVVNTARIEVRVPASDTPVPVTGLGDAPSSEAQDGESFLLVNDTDLTYCLAHPDPDSLAAITRLVGAMEDPLARAVAHSQVWAAVRDARLSPREYVSMAARECGAERHAAILTTVLDHAGQALGEYVPYQTWLPRPVAGTQGLTATGWHKTVETYGAAQLQKRFEAHANRWMNDRDFAAWMGVRSLAAAVTRLRSTDAAAMPAA